MNPAPLSCSVQTRYFPDTPSTAIPMIFTACAMCSPGAEKLKDETRRIWVGKIRPAHSGRLRHHRDLSHSFTEHSHAK